MAPGFRVIIDTDPGVDDILAMLLAFSFSPEELEVVLISLTFGNIDVQNCLRNVVSLFHIIEKEQAWRRQNGIPEGFDTLKSFRPIVAVGAERPLSENTLLADFFHGIDGLGGIHTSHPHLTPAETWKTLFDLTATVDTSSSVNSAATSNPPDVPQTFTPSNIPAHKEILRVLAENPENTIKIIAVGPLTNLALAAAEDPVTFLRAEEVIVMGGAIDVPGNITPLAEFNIHSDPIAAARIFALTSLHPPSTLPIPSLTAHPAETPYPHPLPKQLPLTLFPLDVTTPHRLTAAALAHTLPPLQARGSPLATWTAAFMAGIAARSPAGLSLHDPLCVWYAADGLTCYRVGGWAIAPPRDVRVETAGQWTRGACVVDRRATEEWKRAVVVDAVGQRDALEDVPGDAGGWIAEGRGNRVKVCLNSPDREGEKFAQLLLRKVFGG